MPVEAIALLPYLLNEAVPYLTLGGTGYLAWRFVRAYERRGVEPDQLRALARRLEYLEVTVETLEDQVRQTAEAQRFTTRLLAGDSRLQMRAPRE
jgi:hypothetical protein